MVVFYVLIGIFGISTLVVSTAEVSKDDGWGNPVLRKDWKERFTEDLNPIRLIFGWPVLIFLGLVAVLKTPWKIMNTPFSEMNLPKIKIDFGSDIQREYDENVRHGLYKK